jgi:hypothetical protein
VVAKEGNNLMTAKMLRQLIKAVGALRSSVEDNLVQEILRQVPQYQMSPEYLEWNRPEGLLIPKVSSTSGTCGVVLAWLMRMV